MMADSFAARSGRSVDSDKAMRLAPAPGRLTADSLADSCLGSAADTISGSVGCAVAAATAGTARTTAGTAAVAVDGAGASSDCRTSSWRRSDCSSLSCHQKQS